MLFILDSLLQNKDNSFVWRPFHIKRVGQSCLNQLNHGSMKNKH